MPSRNIVRSDIDESYYHVYARGASRLPIFIDDDDKSYFIYLLTRHLGIETVVTKKGYTYPNYRGEVELLVYCLMGNHFHLLLYQNQRGALSELMRSIMVSYTTYFNRKYKRSGPLFESRFKASLINKDDYLLHVARYILLNPRYWEHYHFSSINYIRKGNEPDWLQTEKLLQFHSSRKALLEFVSDYEENKAMIDELKHELAHT